MNTSAPLWTIGLVLFCALLGALGQLFFKLGSASVSLDISSWLINWKVLLGMVLYGISAVFFGLHFFLFTCSRSLFHIQDGLGSS